MDDETSINATAALIRLQRTGLESAYVLIEALQQGQCPVRAWANENLPLNVGRRVALSELYDTFAAHSIRNQLDPISKRVFARKLADAGYVLARSESAVCKAAI